MPVSRARNFLAVVMLGAGLAACSSPAADPVRAAQPQSAGAPLPAFPTVEKTAEKYVEAGTVANLVAGIALPDGRNVWIRKGTLAFGSDIPADEHSLYRIYSMTKPITGVAAALLIDEGKLALDQPVSDFFPAFARQRVLTDKDVFGATRPPTGPLTVRHLMTHTSGLGYSIVPSALAEEYSKAGIVPGVRRINFLRPSGPQPASLEEFAERAAALPLRTDPGAEWHYSIGLDVLGAVIEKASGMPFERFLKERLFTPLGMDDTGFVVPGEDVVRLTTNYVMTDGKTVLFDSREDSEYTEATPYPAGGAGLVSTAEDYLRFMTAMANGGRLGGRQALPASAVALATSDLLLPPVKESQPNQGFGAGGRLTYDPDTGELVGYGWGGAASTVASAMPHTGSAFVIMTQLLRNESPMRDELPAAMMADLAALAPSR